MRVARRLLFFTGGLCAVLLLLLTGGYFYVTKIYPPEKIAQVLQSKIENTLKLPVLIDSVSYTFHGKIEVKNIRILDTPVPNTKPTSQAPSPLLQIQNLTLHISLPLLIRKKVEIRAIELERIFFLLSQPRDKKKYQVRWQEVIDQIPSQSGGAKMGNEGEFKIKKIRLEKLEIHKEKDLKFPVPEMTGNVLAQFPNDSMEFEVKVEHTPDSSTFIKAQVSPGLPSFFSAKSSLVNVWSNLKGTGKIAHKKTPGQFISEWAGTNLPLSEISGESTFSFAANTFTYNTGTLSIIHRSGQTIVLQSQGIYDLAKGNFLSPGTVAQIGSARLSLRNLEKEKGKSASFAFGLEGKIETLSKMAGLKGSNSGTIVAKGFMRGKTLSQINLSITDFHNITGSIETKIPLLKADFDGKTWKIPATEIISMGTKMNLMVNYRQSGVHHSLQLIMSAPELKLENLVQKLSGITGGSSSGKEISFIETLASLRIGKVTYAGYQWENVHFNIQASPTGVSLSSMGFRFAGGTFSGSMERGSGRKYTFNFSYSGLRMNDLLKMASAKGAIRATCHGKAEGNFQGETALQIQETLRAKVSFTSGTGRISNTFLQKGYLNGPLSPLEDKLSDIEFSSSELMLQASDGKIHITNAYFDAQEWSIRAGGQIDYQLKGEAHTTLKFQESFIENIANPLQLGIEDTKLGVWYSLPFSCAGNLGDSSCWRREW